MSFELLNRKPFEAAALTNDHDPIRDPLQNPSVSSYFRWKGMVDRPLAAVLLVLTAPVIALLWLLVKCTSSGPGFYRQERSGQFGRPFMMFKLRTMRQDAEAVTGAIWSSTNDPRITRLGWLLRKFHLDELPQLVNVLKGEMSLVGPRPERPEFVDVLAAKIDRYCDRLMVPPGITGLAQLNLPPDTDLHGVERKLVLDLEYVREAGPWLEARLLICTATRLLKVPTIRLLGLHRAVKLPNTKSRMATPAARGDPDSSAAVSQQAVNSPHNGNGQETTPAAVQRPAHPASPSKPR